MKNQCVTGSQLRIDFLLRATRGEDQTCEKIIYKLFFI